MSPLDPNSRLARLKSRFETTTLKTWKETRVLQNKHATRETRTLTVQEYMLRSLIHETRQSAVKQERHMCICHGLCTMSQNKSLAKKRAYVRVRLPLWVMKGNNRAEREAPTTILIQTPLKSWSPEDGLKVVGHSHCNVNWELLKS